MKTTILFPLFLIVLTMSCKNVSSKMKQQATANDVVVSNDTCKVIDKYLSQLEAENNFSGGLLIIKNGKKIFSKGYGWANKAQKIAFTPATLASMGSITKAFTAAGILKLGELGKLSVNDNLKKFFPDVPSDKAAITIQQLLTHSSGFHEFLKNDGGDYEKIETKEYLKKAFDEPLAFTPGEKAVYTNVGMSILAIILEQVSGMEYEAFLKNNLFKKAGIENIGYALPLSGNFTIAQGYRNGKDWGTHQQHFATAGGGPYWNLKGNGGLEASLNDMYLWATAISDNTMLNSETTEKMFTPHIIEEGTEGRYSFGYGCTIAKSRRGTKMIDNGGSNGIYFARLIRLPDEGLIFYMITNESSINTNRVLPNITQLYFSGKITDDAIAQQPNFESPVAEKIYTILTAKKVSSLEQELKNENIIVEDDMILLEAGQRLIEEQKADEALLLYQYYTKTFPQIIVSWNDMGDVYLMKNNKQEAINCYRQALKLRPGNPRAKENLERLNKK
jgi:CubicO group peptidase (beta-lactamase class C family)